MRVLLIEDEIILSEAISHIIKKNNYIVDTSYDGEDGLYNALSNIYDIIILDIMLPKLNGLDLIKKIRENNIDTPCIMLTAKSDTNSIVTGLSNGADDYLTKPFVSEELLARIKTILRRKNKAIINSLNYQNISLDMSNLKLSSEEKQHSLTLKEAQILELFITNKEIVISKTTMIEKLWGYDSDALDNNVEVYISFLRKKLNTLNTKVRIKTIRNLGYVLKCE